MLCLVELMLFLSHTLAKLNRVWLCSRCSLGWRVHPKMTALDASGAKVQQIMDIPSIFAQLFLIGNAKIDDYLS